MSDNSSFSSTPESLGIASYESGSLEIAFSLDTQRETQLKHRGLELTNKEKEDNLRYRFVLPAIVLKGLFQIKDSTRKKHLFK